LRLGRQAALLRGRLRPGRVGVLLCMESSSPLELGIATPASRRRRWWADDGTDARGSSDATARGRRFRTPGSGGRAGAMSREAMRERGAVFRQPAPGGDSVQAARRDGVRKALLGNECLPNRCSCPSVRAVNRWNLLGVELLGDLLQRHPLPEQRVELTRNMLVTLVAEPMRKPDVVGREATSVHFESRIVVGRRHPIGTRRYRLEVPTTPKAVARGHLATHVDDLAIPGDLPEDSANSQGLEPLNWSFLSVRRCRRGSSLRDLLFVVHVPAISPRRWRQSGYDR
jgi:hypothetical protein